jgi:3-oxoadipate enol-lactonase
MASSWSVLDPAGRAGIRMARVREAPMRELVCDIAGDGPPVVLLHPVGLDATFWGGLPGRLARGYRVVAVDLAGHGRSPHVARPGRMAAHVADVAGLVERLGRGPAVLVGVSFGGMIAQQLALARPDMVTGLMLAGCPGAIPGAGRAAILDRGRAAEVGGMAAVADATLARWFTPGFLAAEAVKRVRARLMADDPSDWAATWEAVAEHDALGRLGAVGVPALVIAGEMDAATPAAATRALAAALPRGRLTVLAGAPHMMQIECAAEFAAAVEGFLAEPAA